LIFGFEGVVVGEGLFEEVGELLDRLLEGGVLYAIELSLVEHIRNSPRQRP
jgi:hypothetical protein